jgi:transposase
VHVVYPYCCGLDVHKRSITVCVLLSETGGKGQREIRRFGTMTRDLLELADWLQSQHVTHVAMESTGVYWKPVWNILEGQFAVVLVNAQHIKAVPGRKTNIKDCQWIAELLQHGLLRGSFVPPTPIRQLRDLTRMRASLRQDHTAIANRMQKILEDANIKLAAVASDWLGVSGRAILAQLLAGEEEASKLAELSRGRLRSKLPAMQLALGDFQKK